MLCVCLSQIQKCLFMYETNMLEKNTVTNFEKVCILFLLSYLILVLLFIMLLDFVYIFN